MDVEDVAGHDPLEAFTRLWVAARKHGMIATSEITLQADPATKQTQQGNAEGAKAGEAEDSRDVHNQMKSVRCPTGTLSSPKR